MSIGKLFILIVAVGLAMWLVNKFIPMAEPYKQILNVLVPVVLVLYLILRLLRMGGLA